MAGQSIIDQRTGISIAVACTLGSGLFLAGNYMGKVDSLERMNIPHKLAAIQADLGIIKSRLGIPNASQVYDQTSLGQQATSPLQWRQLPQPLQAARASE